MPIDYARRLTGHERTPQTNRHLSFALAFVAGAINAGGFLAVQQYTSHMTGIVSAMSDNIALGAPMLVWNGRRCPAADRRRLKTLSVLALSFFVGGVVGALGFKYVGYLSTVPLAVLLTVLGGVPALDDLRVLLRRWAGG